MPSHWYFRWVQGTWQLTFTASHWQRIAGPVEEVGPVSNSRTVADF